MANSSTVLGTDGCPINYHDGRVIALSVVLDTINTDLELFNTPSTERAAIVGISYGVAAAHNLIIKSGLAASSPTSLVTIVRPANSELFIPIGQGVLWAGLNKGDRIILNTSAAIATMLVYLAIFNQIPIK